MANLFVKHKIIAESYLRCNVTNIDINLTDVNDQPKIKIQIGQNEFIVVLDTGSSYNILPYSHFKDLNIPLSNLCKTSKYTIQSATHKETDAVIGSIQLTMRIMSNDKSYQFVNCPFLVLKEHLSLPTILLGNQFLYQTNTQMTYNDVGLVKVQINYKYVENYQTCNSDQIFFTKLGSSSTTQKHGTHPSHTLQSQNQSSKPDTSSARSTSRKAAINKSSLETSIFKEQTEVNYDIFSSFVSNCRFEKIKQTIKKEGKVTDVYSAAIRDFDEQYDHSFMQKAVIPSEEPDMIVSLDHLTDRQKAMFFTIGRKIQRHR